MKYSLAVILFFVSGILFAQPSREIELQLAGYLNKMSFYKYQSPNDDSVMIGNKLFKTLLIKYLSETQYTTGDYLDTVVNSGLMRVRSEDNSLRIYSWDTQTGGTMRFYDNIYEYQSNGKIYIKTADKDTIEGNPKSWYSEIYTMDDGDKKYYLGVYNADYSTMEKAQGINFFSIEGAALNDVNLAKTKEGLSSGIGTNYNFFSIPDNEERPFRIVKYNDSKKTITVPVFKDNGDLTNKTIVYKFRNGYFEEVK